MVSGCDVWAVGDDAADTQSEGLIEHWTGSGSWTVAATVNLGDTNVLSGISAVSASDVWAVGYTSDATDDVSHTLIEHWDGSSWTHMTSPSPGLNGNVLSGVTAISANDAWAVGSFNSGNGNKTLIEHWDGSNWQQVASTNPGTASNSLAGVTATSATNAWAVGTASSGVPGQTLIERWDGSAWRTVNTAASVNPGTNGNALTAVTATSAANAWAVGSYNDDPLSPKTLVEHWDGSSWTRQPSADPDSHSNELLGVTATSATSAWAVGISARFTGFPQALTEHWDGTAWQPMTSPQPGQGNYLLAVGSSSSGFPWAVGGSDGHALVTTMTAVPDVLGQMLANAASGLQAAGLRAGPVTTTGNCDPSAAGTVLATSPPAGAVLPGGSSVSLTECFFPPPPSIVPGLFGDTRAEAAQELEAAGFALGAVHTQIDNSCENLGTVMSQSPAGGTQASRGTAVSITLGRAPKHCGL